MVERETPKGGEVGRFRTYLANDWGQWLDEYPELGTVFGLPGFDDRWTDDSPKGIEARRRHLRESLDRLRALHRGALPPVERLNYDLYKELLETARSGLAFGFDPLPLRLGMPHNLWMPLNQMDGVHLSGPDLLYLQPRGSVSEYEAILRRMERLPSVVEQNIALLRVGLDRGFTPPRVAIRGVPDQLSGLLTEDPMVSSLLKPFTEFASRLAEADRVRLVTEARRLYAERLLPAFRELREFVVTTYLPACRETVAAAALPSGENMYRYLVGWQTTTTRTPAEIHRIGLAEVERIRAAMESVKASAGFPGSLAEFFEFLRTDPRFFHARAEDLLDGYRILGKKIDPTLGRLFGRLPRLPYGVAPVPEFRAPSSPTAYYLSGAASTGRPGTFYANTYDLTARPRWEMEALALHESVPGHHLQIALAEELDGTPDFRRYSGYTAFVEGWGLYAESLGEELGFYQDPYSRFGQLTYDIWRSIRLVVDTGMHALGWSRDRAIQFFRDNSGKSELDIQVEVDRYIVWPGQALAYKIGQLKLRELRTYSEKHLGERFDVRGFHDLVLGEGAVTLGLLEARVHDWVERLSASREGPRTPSKAKGRRSGRRPPTRAPPKRPRQSPPAVRRGRVGRARR